MPPRKKQIRLTPPGMRATTVEIPEKIYWAIRQNTVNTRRTMRAVIIEIYTEWMDRQREEG